MVDSQRLKYHNKYSNFLSPQECQDIISIINRDKDDVPTGSFETTGYYGLTASYDRYNWLHHEDIKPYHIEERLFNLECMSDWGYMVTQCWCNELKIGENLPLHYHGSELNNEALRRYDFYSANIFLGGEYNITWYEDMGEVENSVGDIHIFSSDLEHAVYENTGSDSRYSIAIDIHPQWVKQMDNLTRWRISKNV